MDILTFIAKLADSLAWPLVVVITLILLRRPLSELLPQVKKLRYKELEAEFGREVAQIDEKVSSELPEKVQAAPLPESAESKLLNLAGIAPNAAVLEAWKSIEESARSLIAQRGHQLDADSATPYFLIERVLSRGGILEPAKIKIFRDLRLLRNKVAHAEDFPLSSRQAAEYVRVAMTLCRYLDDLQQADPQTGQTH